MAGAQFQSVIPVFGVRNNFRYPAYQRLDLGIVYKWWTKRKLENDLTLSVYNASDRRNPYFIYLDVAYADLDTGGGTTIQVPNAIKAKQVSLFPILPSVTWNFKF